MFREAFFMDNNEFLLNFVANFQGWGFSFLRLCSDICTPWKGNVVEGRLFFGLDNAFDALPSHEVKPTWGFHKVKLRKLWLSGTLPASNSKKG
jgi:hypothetical protein